MIGDPAGPELHTHQAHYQGELAIRMALGDDVTPDYRALVRASYTDPEAAFAGVSAEQAKADGIDAVEFVADFATSARGYSVMAKRGHVTVVFDRASRKLLHQSARTELMDHTVPLDPVVLSRTQPQLDRAADLLAEPIGELAANLSVHAPPGEPSEVEQLFGAAITEALAQRGVALDGVFHGLFEDQHVFKKGPKTIGDIWEILPYENFLVTAELTPAELRSVLDEALQSRSSRSLLGFRLAVEGQGSMRRLTSLTRADGRPLVALQRYRIAFNTFDASSGGHRFVRLRDLLNRPETKRTFYPVQTREALIDYFRRHRLVRLS